MLTQLQLEGPELEPLLARVRSELGVSARIVHAEKIRSGGVAGFFASERFELTVEVDTSAPRTAAPAPRPASPAAVPAPAAAAAPSVSANVSAAGAPAATASAPGAVPAAPATPAAPAAEPFPGAHLELALDRALDLDAAGRAGRDAPFSAIAGLEPGTAPDDTGLFSSLAALSSPAPTGPAPAPAARVPAPALAAASAYAPQSASGGGLPWADVDVPVAARPPVVAPPAVELPLHPAPTELAPAPAAASASASAGFAPHAAFASLVEPGPTRTPSADPSLGLLELADRVSADEHSAVVSTETPSFASLMSRLGDDLGVEADAERPPAPVVLQGEATRSELAPSVPAQRPAVTAPAPRPDTATGAGVTAGTTPAPRPDTATGAGVTAGTAADVAAVSTADGAARAAAAPPARTGTAAALAAAPAADPAAAADAEEAAGADLVRLGLPAHLLPTGGYGSQLHTALRASLTRLPTAPPALNRAGGVLAVVGPPALAVAVAREIAQELGLPVATSVALATSGTVTAQVPERQVLRGTTEAAERRTAWRRRSNLTVVAVDAPLTATGAAEARAFLAALSPSATWGVVEATRKAQDVGAWTRALGGVHALALTDLEDTADPAAVLELGIPVSRLGARPATPRAWATLLTGRLAA